MQYCFWALDVKYEHNRGYHCALSLGSSVIMSKLTALHCIMPNLPQSGTSSVRLDLADVVAQENWICDGRGYDKRDVVQGAPWISLMQQFVPFSQSVCVAGSVGTWLAQYKIHHIRPLWDPSDIDVFVMVPTSQQYISLCDAFLESLCSPIIGAGCASSVRFSAHRKFSHILNVKWWVTWNGIEVQCPDVSLIHSKTILNCDMLLEQFDIDVCKVSVHVEAGDLCLCMSHDVQKHIHDRDMYCVLCYCPTSEFEYPMQKTFTRVQKYAERGYNFKSLQFVTIHSTLRVADFLFLLNVCNHLSFLTCGNAFSDTSTSQCSGADGA